jgi:hypothetical protein
MLFDLRGRGRRSTVRVIYAGLAVLIGVGLVGFGIGGGVGGGGLLNAASKNEGSGGVSFADQVKKYEKLTTQQPNNAAAWEKLIDAQLHEAGGEAYVTRTGITSKGKELFSQVAKSWERYLALNPPKLNQELAQRMVVVYSEEGLNNPAAAVQVLQVVVAARPKSAALYAQLAQYAYKAKNARVGDLAAAKAVSLAPPAQRARLKTELAALKTKPSKQAFTQGANGVYTGTTNGKTFTVQPSSHGSYTGTVTQGATAPAGSATTTTK